MSTGRRLLARLQPCATTGIGSLPFADSAEAVAHVWASSDLPFCPQLPALDGDMVAEWIGAPVAAAAGRPSATSCGRRRGRTSSSPCRPCRRPRVS